MAKIGVIGDKHTVQTFALAGIKDSHIVEDFESVGPVEEAFDRLTGDPDISILFLTHKTTEAISEKLSYYTKMKSLYPILITVPDIFGDGEGKDEIREMIMRAVGVALDVS